MTKITPAQALDLEFFNEDAGCETIRGYFKELLTTLWQQGEGFSGKRPFGNSGWEHDLAFPLVEAGCIRGTIVVDEDDPDDSYVEDFDTKAYDKFVNAMIAAL